jgi:uncharacterized protein YjbI with pentapeptide repeats
MTDEVLPGGLGLPEGYQPPASAEELLRRYAAGERYFPQADVPEQSSLEGCTLEGAVFESAWVSCVSLRGANLRRVRFERCNVKCSDFGGADLRGASFPGTHVEAASFEGANLEGASFAGALAYGGEYREGDVPKG